MKLLAMKLRERAGLKGRALRARKRRPVYRMPRAIERDYFAALLPWLKRLKESVDRLLVPMLGNFYTQANISNVIDSEDYTNNNLFNRVARADVRLNVPAGGGVRTTRVDGYIDAVQALVALLAREFEQSQPTDPALVAMLQSLAERVDNFNSSETTRVVKGVVDIDVVAHLPERAERIAAFVRQNVALIKSIPADYLHEIEQTVISGFRAGERAERISERLQERYDVTENRATLIARDQVGKFYGELTRERQTGLGIARYRWRSSKDERVRPLHKERGDADEGRGMIFRWDTPPDETKDDGHPGTPIQCRCTADPMIEDLLEGLPSGEPDEG